MPDEELNNASPEENVPIDNGSDSENVSDRRQSDQESSEPQGDDISEPTMEESSSLSQNEGDSPEAEGDGSDDQEELSQDEIDKALNAVNGASGETAETADSSVELSQDEIDTALNGETQEAQTPVAVHSPDHMTDDEINVVKSKEFENFGKPDSVSSGQNIDMLLDVTLPISIELGRTSMPIQDILNLGPGSVVELNRLAGEPVDLLVNDKLIAKGEVVVVDENFGVRVTSMVSHEERLKSLV